MEWAPESVRYQFDDSIRYAIADDDKERFISLMNSPRLFSWVSKYAYVFTLWEEVCLSDAVTCATSLLEGEWELGPPMGVNMPTACFVEAFPLHYAAKFMSRQVVELFLSCGARTDIKLADPLDKWLGKNGLLPLEIALDVARVYFPMRIGFSRELSNLQLITALCLSGMEAPLEVIKLLAWSSENVEKKAYYYAMEGKLFEFAILLTVARKKVLVPITFSRQDGDDWDGIMTLHQCLKNEIGSLLLEEYRLGSSAEEKLSWIGRRKMLLRSTELLLEAFERAGNAIEECIQFERHNEEEVMKDVALRLVEAGFILTKRKEGDFDFTIGDWLGITLFQCLFFSCVSSLYVHLLVFL